MPVAAVLSPLLGSQAHCSLSLKNSALASPSPILDQGGGPGGLRQPDPAPSDLQPATRASAPAVESMDGDRGRCWVSRSSLSSTLTDASYNDLTGLPRGQTDRIRIQAPDSESAGNSGSQRTAQGRAQSRAASVQGLADASAEAAAAADPGPWPGSKHVFDNRFANEWFTTPFGGRKARLAMRIPTHPGSPHLTLLHSQRKNQPGTLLCPQVGVQF